MDLQWIYRYYKLFFPLLNGASTTLQILQFGYVKRLLSSIQITQKFKLKPIPTVSQQDLLKNLRQATRAVFLDAAPTVVGLSVQPSRPNRLPMHSNLSGLPLLRLKGKLFVPIPLTQTLRQLPQPQYAQYVGILFASDGHWKSNS